MSWPLAHSVVYSIAMLSLHSAIITINIERWIALTLMTIETIIPGSEQRGKVLHFRGVWRIYGRVTSSRSHWTAAPTGDTVGAPRKPGWFWGITAGEFLAAVGFSILATAVIIVLTVVLMTIFPQARQQGANSESFLLFISTIIVVTAALLALALQIHSLFLHTALLAKRERLKVLHPALYTQVDDALRNALHHTIAS